VYKKTAQTLCFLFLCLAYHTYAQEMYFTNISNSLNLPSQECYNVIQDSKGYIWICTENGLVKYSKDERKVFDKLNGLDENGVYYIAENKPGELELLTSNNRLLILQNDTIKAHKAANYFQDSIKKPVRQNTFNVSYLLNRNANGDLIINSQYSTYLISKSTSQISRLTKSSQSNSDAYLIINKGNGQDYFIKNLDTYFDEAYKNDHIIKIDVVSGGIKKRIHVQLNEESRVDWRIRICNADGITFLTLHNKLIRIDKDLNSECFSFPSVITSINLSSKHGLWVGTSSFGVYHYSNIYDMSKVNTGLKGLSVSSVLVDKEGGTWCTTTEKGVYYSGSYNILYYPQFNELNKKTTLLKAVDHKLFISTEIDKLKFFDQGKINQVALLETGNSDITDIIRFQNKNYIASKGFVGSLNEKFQFVKTICHNISYPYSTTGNITAYQFDTSSTSLYVLGLGLAYKFNGQYFESVGPPLKSKGRSFKVCNDSFLYAGCNDGLYKLDLIHNTQRKVNPINTAVSKIIMGSDGSFYITTKGQGLFKLMNNVAYNIKLDDNSYILNDIIEDRNKHLWISTNDGLIELKSINGKYSIRKYNTSNGLISNNIGQLTIDGDYLYVSSPDGICNFSINENLLNETPPDLLINTIEINGEGINYTGQELDLKYNENSFVITLDRLTYKNGKREGLVYKLKGLYNDYKVVNSNKITFENLPPNNYELIVYAVNNDGVRSIKPVSIKFCINPPFWLRTWFIIGVIILVLLFVFLIARKVIKSIKKKEEEKTRVNKLVSELQLSSLQAQMNPHFIFNAINSIQNYVLNKKEDEAYNYLAKFSKLIRMVLNNTRENELSLYAEIETLNLYIELEQLRFDNSFEYTLTISEEVDLLDIEMPAMLIQPFVENAIWHGLMNLNGERKGMLKVDISIENKLLKVVIEDNGIGRVKSNEFKDKSIHHSVAMKLTEDRLEVLNKLGNTKNIRVVTSDLYNEDNEACGTRVELFLPLVN
jgi:ligand-binding sensor domain-containing protein